MTIKHATVIRHLAFEDLGCYAQVLADNNISVQYYEAAQDDLSQIDPASDDLLIVLGGPISVNQTDIYPFLQDELALLKRRLAMDKPTLGVCLGAQLMAKALGAKIYPGTEKEIGWSPLSLSEAGNNSVLRHFAPPTRVLHWHGETFELPEGAVLLASSELYAHQAFAYGRRALGLQFHGECTAQGLESWYLGHVGEIEQTPGLSVPELRAQAALYAEDAARQGQRFFADWLAQLES
jgi:GMP synthase (glutamine-hydrolysing)